MLSYTDLKKGVIFVMDGQPYEVLGSSFLRMQQRKAVVQTKIRNLITGKVLDRNFQPSDNFEEAEVIRKAAMFIYKKSGRGSQMPDEYWFHEKGNPANRFMLSAEIVGNGGQFLKPNTEVTMVVFSAEGGSVSGGGEKVIQVILPIKMDFKVIEAPPAIKGNTAQGGTKVVEIEGGAKVNAPLFINEGDIIRINTETGEYVERAEKG